MSWTPQERAQGFTTRIRPSLAEYGGKLYMAWRGPVWNQGVYYSSYDYNTNSWLQQQQIQGAVSRWGPSLAEYGEQLRMAWRGIGLEEAGGTEGGQEDQGIHYSSYDGNTWLQQQTVQGVGSEIGPSLAKYGGKLHMAWKGIRTESTDDQTIYYSQFDGNAWTQQLPLTDRGSWIGPSLAEYGGKLYMAWRGVNFGGRDDQTIYYSQYDLNSNAWTQQLPLTDRGSWTGPSLAEYGGKLHMAWRGTWWGEWHLEDDQRIYYSQYDLNSNAWTQQLPLTDRGSRYGPSLAKYGDRLYMAWGGVEHDDGSMDEGIWYSFMQ